MPSVMLTIGLGIIKIIELTGLKKTYFQLLTALTRLG